MAWAGPLALGVGAEAVTNDPFARTFGPRVDVEYRVAPVLVVGLDVGVYPIRGDGGAEDPVWTSLAKVLLEEIAVSPDISTPSLRLGARVVGVPVSTPADAPVQVDLRLGGGFGVVRTEDDLVALQQEGEESAIATQSQVHPTSSLLVGAEAGNGTLGLRAGVEWMTYIETINSYTLESKMDRMMSVELVWHP